jgi:hypothetical protein
LGADGADVMLDIDVLIHLGIDTDVDLIADVNIIAVALTFVDRGAD